jgi:hypothetical protein
LRALAADVVATYDRRLFDEVCMLAFGRAVEKMRKALGMSEAFVPVAPSEVDALPLELQAMQHITSVLGVLPTGAARHRVLVVVALALAPDCFSEREYGELLRRAKGRVMVSVRRLCSVASSMTSPKADAVINWISEGMVRVHFDASSPFANVPKHLRKRTNCVFELAYNMPLPISDLKIDQEGISGTLSFGGYGWLFCKVQWPAVFCVTQGDRVGVWLNDAPEDMQREILRVAGEEANKKLARSRLRLVK